MIAADTNIVLRLFLQDDHAQSIAAQKLFSENTVWISRTVILECEWVLRSTKAYPRDQIELFFDTLIHLDGVVVDDYPILQKALTAYREGMDFADALHLFTANSNDIAFVSFDKKLVKKAKQLKATAELL